MLHIAVSNLASTIYSKEAIPSNFTNHHVQHWFTTASKIKCADGSISKRHVSVNTVVVILILIIVTASSLTFTLLEFSSLLPIK